MSSSRYGLVWSISKEMSHLNIQFLATLTIAGSYNLSQGKLNIAVPHFGIKTFQIWYLVSINYVDSLNISGSSQRRFEVQKKRKKRKKYVWRCISTQCLSQSYLIQQNSVHSICMWISVSDALQCFYKYRYLSTDISSIKPRLSNGKLSYTWVSRYTNSPPSNICWYRKLKKKRKKKTTYLFQLCTIVVKHCIALCDQIVKTDLDILWLLVAQRCSAGEKRKCSHNPNF